MALKAIVDSLDGIPEALHGEYTEKDGRFHLNIEGLPDIEKLESKKRIAEKEAIDRRKALDPWEKIGKTPQEVAELIAKHEEDERKRAEADGDHAKILTQHQQKWAKEKETLEAELNAARTSERGAIISTSVMSALTKASVTEEGADLLPDRLAGRIKYETVDGKRVLKIMQADGETPMAGSGEGGTATFDDLVKEAVSKWPSLFKGTGQSGSGKPPGQGGGGAAKRKSDFKTEKERSAFVDANGMAAYNALPA